MGPAADPRPQPVLTRTLVLVGLMGAGKTSVGRRLADSLKVPFHDSDDEIERAAGMQVREIFARFGEPYFRDGERRVLARLLSGPPSVVATGGGAFVSPQNREAIAERGVSIWIDADLDTLWDRVKDRPTRPLLQVAEPRRALADLLAARRPDYSQAMVRVKSDPGMSHDAMVRRILAAVQVHDEAHPDVVPVLLGKPRHA